MAMREPGTSIEWQKNGRSLSNDPPRNIQINDGYLMFNPVEDTDGGDYTCVLVRDLDNSVLATVPKTTVIVRQPPIITLHPASQTVKPGDYATIKCSAVGTTPITITWHSQRGFFPSHVIENTGELRFNGIKVDDEGKYTCSANNSVGTADSTAEVIVTAIGQSTKTISAGKRDIVVPEGTRAELSCTPSYQIGKNYRIQWKRHGGLPMPPSETRDDDRTLVIYNAQLGDSGRYFCEITTPNSIRDTDFVRLRVARISRDPELKIRIDSDFIRVGDTVDLECIPSENVRVTWSKLGGRLGENVFVIDNNRLRVSDVNLQNSGYYQCSARIRSTDLTSDIEMKIQVDEPYLNDAPYIENIVPTIEAPFGSNSTLSCNHDLQPPVEYTWAKRSNGHILPMKAFSNENSLTLLELKNSDAGMYVCKASNNDKAIEIPTILLVTNSVPAFDQATSYLLLPLTVTQFRFSFEISFKPEDPNGLILYTSDTSIARGDFISFGLEDGYPTFIFDLGSGSVTIKSNFSVGMGSWHTVSLKRNKKKGMMFVDGKGPFSGETPGSFQGLDLSNIIFVGGHPNYEQLHPSAGFSRGFQGCISRFVSNDTEFELLKVAVEKIGVSYCNVCKSMKHNPCINFGICQEGSTKTGYTCLCPPGISGENCSRLGEPCETDTCGEGSCQDVDGRAECYCPIGTAGKNCEKKIKVIQPAFKHGSYLAYHTPKQTRKFKMTLRLNPRDVQDGIVMYSAQSDDGLGDFISLAIKDKHMEFRFDTGSGLVILKSKSVLVPHQWVIVTIVKDSKEGKLSVGGDFITGSSPGEKLQVLNLNTPLYVGGYNVHHINPAIGVEVNKGFHGCISQIDVFRSELDLINSAVDSANILDCSDLDLSPSCEGKPCENYGMCYPAENQRGYNCSCLTGYSGHHCEVETSICMKRGLCKNNGICRVTSESYKCLCTLGYAQPNCEKKVEIQTDIHFMGEGYIELRKNIIEERRNEEWITFDFVTSDKNALLLWNGQPSYQNGLNRPFIAVAIVNGVIEYSYDVGDGVVTIKYPKKRINDGIKHSVNVTRINNYGSLEVDNVLVGKGENPGSHKIITARGNIYLGGTPNMDYMTGGRYTHPLKGLMLNLRIQHQAINIASNATNGLNVMPWIR